MVVYEFWMCGLRAGSVHTKKRARELLERLSKLFDTLETKVDYPVVVYRFWMEVA